MTEEPRGEKPKRFYQNLSNTVLRTFTRNRSVAEGKEEPLGDVQRRSRGHGIFRSIKKRLKRNKQHPCKKMTCVENGTEGEPADDLYEEPVTVRRDDDKPPVPPRRIITQNLDDNENSQYLDTSELNQAPKTVPKNKSLAWHLFNLTRYGWFWGPITKHEAEKRLSNEPDGSFLIRDSSSDRFIFTVSFRCCGQTMHSHIEYSYGMFSMGEQLERSTVAELVKAAMDVSTDSVFFYSRSRDPTDPAYPVRLTRPVSRRTEVKSLQYLCRFTIRQCININNISNLPLPNTLKGYLQQAQY